MPEQAVSILSQMREKKASEVLYLRGDREPGLLTPTAGNLVYEDPQFLEDDLAKLVEIGLLRMSYTSAGNPNYYFTRDAAALVDGMKKEESKE